MNRSPTSARLQAVHRCFAASIVPNGWRAAVLTVALFCIGARPLQAETIAQQSPQVRTEYAQVLKVEPIYQTLRAYASEEQCDPPPRVGSESAKPPKCRMVRVPREFRRVIAYDVDYIHRGMKYRSRLPYDPGTRLQVKVSVMPVLEPESRR
jgi:uncharacterized protein YcfJ